MKPLDSQKRYMMRASRVAMLALVLGAAAALALQSREKVHAASPTPTFSESLAIVCTPRPVLVSTATWEKEHVETVEHTFTCFSRGSGICLPEDTRTTTLPRPTKSGTDVVRVGYGCDQIGTTYTAQAVFLDKKGNEVGMATSENTVVSCPPPCP